MLLACRFPKVISLHREEKSNLKGTMKRLELTDAADLFQRLTSFVDSLHDLREFSQQHGSIGVENLCSNCDLALDEFERRIKVTLN